MPTNTNRYQLGKAKQIVAFLLACQGQSTLSRHQLGQVVALMDASQWRTVCFSAGVPVADIAAKVCVLALIRNRQIHTA